MPTIATQNTETSTSTHPEADGYFDVAPARNSTTNHSTTSTGTSTASTTSTGCSTDTPSLFPPMTYSRGKTVILSHEESQERAKKQVSVSSLIAKVRECSIDEVRDILSNLAEKDRIAFINEPTTDLKNTALHYACIGANFIQGPNEELVRLLLENGADVHATNIAEETPLHCAAKFSHDERICESLVQHGARCDARNLMGMSAKEMTRVEGCLEVLRRGEEAQRQKRE